MSETLNNNRELNNQDHPLSGMPNFDEHMRTMNIGENDMYMSEKGNKYDFATPNETQNMSERIEQMDFDDLSAIHERLTSLVEVANLTRTELDGEYRNCYLEKDGDEFRIVVSVNSHFFDQIDDRDMSWIPSTSSKPIAPEDFPSPTV